MKTLLSFAALCFLALSLKAQTPPNKNVAIINKTTATWCGPCGSWGWTLFEDIITDNQAKAICMGTYGSSSSDMYNQTAGDFYNDFASGAGWPAYCAIGINRTAYSTGGGIFPTTTQSNVKSTVDSFVATPVKASTGYKYTISGSTLNVTTVNKFWAAGSGDYYVNVYLVEDGVMNTQNGQTGVVAHHHVLRGGVTGTWGANLINGAVTAGQIINKTFTYTIPSTWDKSKLEVVTVIWKKVGTDYQFINANNISEAPVGISTIEEAGNIHLFPNPTSNMSHLVVDISETTNVSILVTDLRGQVVYQHTDPAVGMGKYNADINTASWANGNYFIKVNVGDSQYSGKIAIMK